jgi:hypothetical protein
VAQNGISSKLGMRIAAATQQEWHFAAALVFPMMQMCLFRCGTNCPYSLHLFVLLQTATESAVAAL